VATGLGHDVDQAAADFVGERLELGAV